MTDMLSFPALCVRFLELYDDDTYRESLPALTRDMLTALAISSPEQIDRGLLELWPLMRHLCREDCWPRVVASLPSGTPIRRDIYEHVYGEVLAGGRESPDLLEISAPASDPSHEDSTTVDAGSPSGRVSEPRPVPEAIDQFVRSFHPDGDPIARTLPDALQYYTLASSRPRFLRYGDFELNWSDIHFATLATLTRALYPILEDDSFWAILGPVHDALRYDDEDGFSDKIERGRWSVITTRFERGTADLYDYWLALTLAADDDERSEAMEHLLKYLASASCAECEEFFLGFDGDSDPRHPHRARWFEPDEIQWPNVYKLWSLIVQKPDVSVWLLARAGFYYWYSSRAHRGPSKAFAALGIGIERLPWMIWHDMVPFLPFWAAARSAASEGRFELSAHYVNRALLDIALYAKALDADELNLIDEEPFDIRFIRDLTNHLSKDIVSGKIPLTACVRLASRMCAAAGIDEWAQVWRVLNDLAQKLKTNPEADTVRKVVGERLRQLLEERTWDCLVAAEVAWERQDFNAVGLHYRSALEHEWQRKIGDLLSRAGATYEHRLSFGRMVRWLAGNSRHPARGERELLGTMGRALLAGELGPSNILLKRSVLEEADRVCKEYLNAATHDGGGLNQESCSKLRKRLLDDGKLRAWLEAVQVQK